MNYAPRAASIRPPRRQPHAFLVLIAIVVLVGIGAYVSHRWAALASVQQHHQQWVARQPAQYTYHLRLRCFCAPPLTEPVAIEVQHGTVTAITFVETGEAVAPGDQTAFATMVPIERLFDRIQAAVRDGAAVVNVAYDPQYGYPTHIDLDASRWAVDDAATYVVDQFVVRP